MHVRAVVVGMVVGLLFGAGIASLVWALVTDGGGSEVAVVCDLVERTETPDENIEIEEVRWWAGLAELMVAVAKADPAQQPLADALADVARGIQLFDFDKVSSADDQARVHCAEL